MALVTKSEEPRTHVTLVTMLEPKIRLGTRVIDFGELSLSAIIIKIDLKIQYSCSLFLFGILPVNIN